MSYTPFVVAWSCLAIVVIALAIYRSISSLHEDDNIHIAAGEQQMIPGQLAFFKKMDKIDRWGKSLTIVTVGTGLVLAIIFLYHSLEGRF